MNGKIALITILTDNVAALARFYREVLGFQVADDHGEYVELQCEGVRFAICARSTLEAATGHPSFREPRSGQTFELAFPLDKPDMVDRAYEQIIAQGATAIKAPAFMPWGQKTAFFADPDGNIHELFADAPEQ